MPQVPRISQRRTLRPGPVVTPDADAFGAQTGRAIQGLGQGVSQAAESLDNIRLTRANTQAKEEDTRRAARLRELMHDPDTGFMHKRGRAALDARADLDAALEKIGADYGAADDSLAHRAINDMWQRRLAQAQIALDQHTAREDRSHQNSVDGARGEEAIRLIEADPYSAETWKTQTAIIARSMLDIGLRNGESEGEIRNKIESTRSALARGLVTIALDNGQYDRAQALLARHGDHMLASDQSAAKGAVRREGERLAAKARAERDRVRRGHLRTLKGVVLMLRDGHEPPADVDLSHKQFIAIHGREDGQRLWEEFKEHERFGETMHRLAMATPDERRELLGDLAQAVEDASPDDYERVSRDLQLALEANQKSAQVLLEDPADYVAQRSETVQLLRADMLAADPGSEEAQVAAQDYVDAVRAEQERLGVPQGLQRNLSVEGAKQVAARLNAAPEGEKGAAVSAYLGQFGPEVEPEIRGELRQAGLNPIVAQLADYRDDALAIAEIETASMIDPKDIKSRLETGEGRAMVDTLRSEFAAFGDVFLDGAGAEAINNYNQLFDTGMRIGMAKLGAGATPAKAAEIAADALLGRFEIIQGSNISGIVPRSANVTEAQIEAHAGDLLSSQAVRDWLGELPTVTDGDKTAYFDFLREERAIQTGRFVYVNTPRFEGFELHKVSDGVMIPAVNRNGERLRFRPEEAADQVVSTGTIESALGGSAEVAKDILLKPGRIGARALGFD